MGVFDGISIRTPTTSDRSCFQRNRAPPKAIRARSRSRETGEVHRPCASRRPRCGHEGRLAVQGHQPGVWVSLTLCPIG